MPGPVRIKKSRRRGGAQRLAKSLLGAAGVIDTAVQRKRQREQQGIENERSDRSLDLKERQIGVTEFQSETGRISAEAQRSRVEAEQANAPIKQQLERDKLKLEQDKLAHQRNKLLFDQSKPRGGATAVKRFQLEAEEEQVRRLLTSDFDSSPLAPQMQAIAKDLSSAAVDPRSGTFTEDLLGRVTEVFPDFNEVQKGLIMQYMLANKEKLAWNEPDDEVAGGILADMSFKMPDWGALWERFVGGAKAVIFGPSAPDKEEPASPSSAFQAEVDQRARGQ